MKTSFLRPLRLLTFLPCYSGNGGYSSLATEVMKWYLPFVKELAKDSRIAEVREYPYGDTPIDMVRNRAVKAAQDGGFDLLLMIDSDMHLDYGLKIGRPGAKPFWESSFEFVYERMRQGDPTCIFGPYCGGGDHHNPFGFEWQELQSYAGSATDEMSRLRGLTLEAVTRNQAAEKRGIQPIAAGPTGLVLYTMDVFDRCWPSAERGKPFFDYERKDPAWTEKASTEDVYNTRNLSLGGWEHLQKDVVFCNWDAWAGHIKPETVGPPVAIGNARASAKILAYLELEREAEEAAIRQRLEAQGVLFGDPEPQPQEPAVASPIAAMPDEPDPVDAPYPFADDRISPATLRDVDRLVNLVLDARKRKRGDILVAYDRDLAITRTVVDAVLRRGEDINVFYNYGDDRTLTEIDACRKNGPALDKQFQQTTVPRKLDSGVRPEGVSWDGDPTHLVIDLRTKPYEIPLAKHAYAYLSLVEPLGWRHSETIHYRQDKSVRSVWFGVNEDLAEPEAARDEREPVAV